MLQIRALLMVNRVTGGIFFPKYVFPMQNYVLIILLNYIYIYAVRILSKQARNLTIKKHAGRSHVFIAIDYSYY